MVTRWPCLPLLFSGMTLIACSPSSRTINVQLVGDQSNADYRMIKVVGISGPRVLFAQTYSCDHKDCWPAPEQPELQSLYGPGGFSTRDMTAAQLKRQTNHQSVLRWKGHVTHASVVVRAGLYSGRNTEISRAERTMNSSLFSLWGNQLRVVERESKLEISTR